MGRHIIRTFHAVGPGWITVWHEAAHESFQITPDIAVCVFCYQQRSTGMSQEDVTNTVDDSTLAYE